LGFLIGAIFFRTVYTIISRYFYAQKDTRTPLYVSLFAIALNIFLAFTLARPIAAGGYDVAGLAIAQSIVAAFEVFVLMIVMLWRDPKLFNIEFWVNPYIISHRIYDCDNLHHGFAGTVSSDRSRFYKTGC
jgi:peptidoglycan biosynthesis protein MviN/MurJ (putative lipid II flippase)